MELLHGQNLRSLLRAEQRLPVARAVNIAIDVCLGLHVAHTAGLVHRDLKPENLWLSRGDDGREKCILLDFGVARFDGAHTTSDGVLVGTARYMSPEQIGAERVPGPASDLFSVGLVLYECLTGVAPFTADSLERTLFRIVNDTQPPASSLVEEVPHELSSVLDRVLAKEPEQRFRDALDFAASLRPFAGVIRLLPSLDLANARGLGDETLAEEPVVNATPYGAPPDSARPAPSSRRALALSFGVGLLLGAASWAALSFDPAPSSRSTMPSAAPLLTASAANTSPKTSPAVPPGLTNTGVRPNPSPSANVPSGSRSRQRGVMTAAPSAPKPARPEPPRPTFDDRNPYRP
jgi:serine/threonine-protein kinase